MAAVRIWMWLWNMTSRGGGWRVEGGGDECTQSRSCHCFFENKHSVMLQSEAPHEIKVIMLTLPTCCLFQTVGQTVSPRPIKLSTTEEHCMKVHIWLTGIDAELNHTKKSLSLKTNKKPLSKEVTLLLQCYKHQIYLFDQACEPFFRKMDEDDISVSSLFSPLDTFRYNYGPCKYIWTWRSCTLSSTSRPFFKNLWITFKSVVPNLFLAGDPNVGDLENHCLQL